MVHEIRTQLSAVPGPATIHHWRSAGGAEVDLLVERDGVFHPFEIKLTANPTRRDGSGIQAFRAAHPTLTVGKGAILCAAERPLWITEDIAAIPWDQA
jgi:hypothetical protein